MQPFTLTTGTAPLLISIPHNSASIPADMMDGMTDVGRSSIDTDWFLGRLYAFAADLEASVLTPAYSRYVIDLNRSESDESLYPGQTTTGLFPVESFDGEPLFQSLRCEEDNARRLESLWRPYHGAIQSELNRLHDEHGRAVLFEAHSIASVVPRLFDGRLADFNFGTNHGATADASLSDAIRRTIERAPHYTHVFNGRFVGGYITRAYGDPAEGVHSVQLELSQATYLDEPNRAWADDKVAQVQPVLKSVVESILGWLESAGR